MSLRPARTAVLALLLASTLAASLSAAPAVAEGPTDRGETPFWSEEFDGPAGTQVDPAVWTTKVGNRETQGWYNNELQYYTSYAGNSAYNGSGSLDLTARRAVRSSRHPCWPSGFCDYTSARLTTEGTVALGWGRVDVRAKLPTGRGLLPAIWMLGETDEIWPAQGEIDIAEVVGHEPRTAYGTAHGPGYSGPDGIGHSTDLGAAASSGYHVFSVVKEPYKIHWLVDDVPVYTLTPEMLPPGSRWVYEQGMHLLLNVAVGGDWPGSPTRTTKFPATMSVDYVRMYGTGWVDGQMVHSPS
ncbi:glycoside hydrolase family 16 protein [uncultured Nocardioides sp.]|uniref:glycoside hydrolase family 16 protein n=1 Tax=uncultured Nocardioides sp. TaxID=198441 RepID=UPI00260DE523|nr:glycoside hydrolase family 16 protein [uncultured Nocardioides sp.]